MPDIRLTPGCDLEGKVLSRDGEPLPDIDVFAWMREPAISRRGRTDGAGKFRLEGLPLRGRAEVRCSLQTGIEVDLPSPPITLRAPALGELRVTLLADESGEPIRHPHAIVTVFGSGFSTLLRPGVDGCFSRSQTPTGLYQLVAHVPERADATASVVLPDDGLRAPVEIRVTKGGVVRGVVRDAEGRPLGGVTLLAHAADSHYPQQADTDEAGAYVVRGLGTRAWLVFGRPDLATSSALLKVTGSAESPVTHDVVMGIGATVFGRVIRSDRTPAIRALVGIAHADARRVPFELPSTVTNEDGRFELHRVPEGDFVVRSGATCAAIRAVHGASLEVALALG